MYRNSRTTTVQTGNVIGETNKMATAIARIIPAVSALAGVAGSNSAQEIFVLYLFNNRATEFYIQAGVSLFKQYKPPFGPHALRVL